MAKVKNIPELRFPEFEGEWDNNLFVNIASFSKGKGISKADIVENGDTECVRYGELYTIYNEVIDSVKSKTNIPIDDLILSDKNDVIIPASGETQIDIARASCVIREGIALGGDLNIIKSKLDGVYLAYYLNNVKKKEIAALAQGISVVHLYSSQLKTLNINYPKPEEQTKIATFLTAIDKRITLLSKQKKQLELYKQGLMNKIFNRELRLKDVNGMDFPEWEEKILGEIGNPYSGLTGKSKEDFGKGKPYIQYKQIFDDSRINVARFENVTINGNENQNKVEYGDVFFTVSSETPNEIGISSVLLDKVEELYLNSFCFGFRPNSLDDLVPEFARYLFRSDNARSEIVKLAQGSTRYNLSKIAFMRLKFLLPKKEEQLKIATFLSMLDNNIELTTSQIYETVNLKKGLLQKMFI